MVDNELQQDKNALARIILDWNDGNWYISNIIGNLSGDKVELVTDGVSGNTSVKMATWDSSYKYEKNDIVALDGVLYISQQQSNQGNKPGNGAFWWDTLIKMTNLDATTLDGMDVTALSNKIMGGTNIGEFYKKAEVDNLIIQFFNNVDARRLGGKTLGNIESELNKTVDDKFNGFEDKVLGEIKGTGVDSYGQELVNIFDIRLSTIN